jgi:hypothetical protein
MGHTYSAAGDRYDRVPYRFCGRSGLQLPPISFGLWQNFGDGAPLDTQRAMLRTAFDLGIIHFDLANNYGPPYGSAEINFGRLLREDFGPYRDELIISTKAGWRMWPGPYGQGGGGRKYVLARAGEVCESCGNPAPFLRKDGSPYLEPHHTRRVSDGGPDHPRWVGAICPNSHREIHYGEDGEEKNQRLQQHLGVLEGG